MKTLPYAVTGKAHKNQGFTLLELVVAMTVMAVVAVFSVQFISNAVTLYRQSNDRDSLMSDIRFGLERVNREVRNAVPGSLRIEQFDETEVSQGPCVRFWPITTASRYLTLNNSAQSSTVKLLDIREELKDKDGDDTWLIIYPVGLKSRTQECIHDNGESYDCVAPLPEELPEPDDNDEEGEDKTLSLTFADKRFTPATHQRVYFSNEQVRFCIDSTTKQLTRATNKIAGESFPVAQPIAEHIKGGFFTVDNSGLYQMLSLDLIVEKNSETFDFSHKVRLYNAP